MAKFLNKKEQVYDLKLTTYGRYLLSIGKFKPYCYEFFDDNILYDGRYAIYTGSNAPEKSDLSLQFHENQNEIFHRIKNETQYLESLVLFSEIENEIGQLDTTIDGEESAAYSSDESPKQNKPATDIYRFDNAIGDVILINSKQTAPAWKVIALNGFISSSSESNEYSEFSKIPQINMNLNYKKVTADLSPSFGVNERYNLDLTDAFALESGQFSDNKIIKIIPQDAVVYIEETNTQLLMENFDIEFFERIIEESTNGVAEIGFQAADAELNGETFTINDGTNSVTFTWTTGTVDSNTKINASYDGVFEFWTMSLRAKLAIENYISGGGSLNVSVSNEMHKVIITNTNGTGIVTNTMGGPSPGTAKVTSSDEEKMITSGGFFTGGKDAKEQLNRKYFKQEINQVVDGFMTTPTPVQSPDSLMTTGSSEYYFDFLVDERVSKQLVCRGQETYARKSYFINLDHNCEDFAYDLESSDGPRYFDIYGYVTEPEICQD